jgi:hypothetical protein
MSALKKFEVILAGTYWQRVTVYATNAEDAEINALVGDYPQDEAQPIQTADEFVNEVTEIAEAMEAQP